MENILGIDSDLESTESIESQLNSPEVEAATLADMSTPAPIIPTYASEPQVAVPTDKKVLDPFDVAFNNANKKFDQDRAAEVGLSRTYYDPKTKERYRQDSSIYNDYYNPNVDYEQVAYDNWDKWDAVSSGLAGFKENFASSYGEYFRYDRVAKAIFNLDADYLKPDETDLDRMAYEQRQNEIKNPIYYSPGTENDFLTKGFLAETISSLGFTLGTLGGVATEQLAFKGIEMGLAATGIGAAAIPEVEIAGDIKSAKGLSKVWDDLVGIFTGKALNSAEYLAQEGRMTSNALRQGKALSSTDDIVHTMIADQSVVTNPGKYGTKFWDNALNLATKVPFVGEVADAARLYRAGKGTLTTGELFKIGMGGLRRAVGEWQLAAGEASSEAGSNYKDLVDQLKDEYRNSHGGQEPIGQDLLNIKSMALKSAGQDFGGNVAILGIMNKIQWGNVFGKFGTESKAISKLRLSMGQEASELGILAVEQGGKSQLYQKGFFGTAGLLPKISEKFGRKKAAWELGKSMVKGVTKIELTEGIQENLQDVVTSGLKDYYVSLYKKDPTTWGDSFHEALNQQISKQGLKTFASGALTGVFLGPGMHVVQHASQAFDKNARAHKEAVAKSVEYLNTLYNSKDGNVLKETIKNIKLQTMFNDGMKEGLQTGDKYQYYNNKDSAFIQTIMHAKRTGTLRNFTSYLEGYGKMSNEEFKSAFGYSPEELGKSSAAEIGSQLAKEAQEYSDIYDHYQTKFGLMMNMQDYINDPAARQRFSVKTSALLDAISTAAFVHSKSNASIKRQAGIRERIASYESIGKSLSTAFGTVVSPEKLDDSVLLLKDEIKTLKKSVTADLEEDQKERTLKKIDEKQRELDILSKIKSSVYRLQDIQDPTDSEKTIKVYDTKALDSSHESFNGVADLIAEYLQIKNNQSGIDNKVSADEVRQAMNDIYDYMSLGQDHQEYVDAMNMLNDPDKFGKYHQRLMDARVAAHARSLYDDFHDLAEMSSVARKFIDDNREKFDKLLAFSNKPSGTYENMYELKKINDELASLSNQVLEEKVNERVKEMKDAADKVAAEEAIRKEEEAKLNKLRESKLPKPLIDMLTQAQDTNDSDLFAQIDEYMAMRYDLEELNNFPFEETDITKRLVNRYYVDNNGNKVRISKDIKIPLVIPGTDLEINNLDNLLTYLYALEQKLYDNHKAAEAKATMTEAQSSTVIEKTDDVKDDLANHVGNPVMFNGQKGKLEVENNAYVVKFDDGTTAKITDIKEGEQYKFADFTELSPAYESLDEETKSEISSGPSAITETTSDGTLHIELDENYLEEVTINGIRWKLEKDENGFVIGFVNEFQRKKGKKYKTFIRRLSIKDKKGPGIKYAAAINELIARTKELSEDINELVDESDVLDAAINEAEKIMFDEMSAKRRSDELILNYQISKILNEDIPNDILEIKAKFDNRFKRNQLSNDELMKLFMWADDADKKIIKKFRLQLTNPVVSTARASLNKDYINAISEKINARESKRGSKQGSKRATTTSVKEKKSVAKLTEELESRKGKRSTPKSEPKPKKQKSGKRTVKSEVEAVQAEIAFPIETTEITEVTSADVIQNLPTLTGAERINSIPANRVNQITSIVDPSAVPTVDESTETVNTDNPFLSLLNNYSCES